MSANPSGSGYLYVWHFRVSLGPLHQLYQHVFRSILVDEGYLGIGSDHRFLVNQLPALRFQALEFSFDIIGLNEM